MSPEHAMWERERATCSIERSVLAFWESGAADRWFDKSDPLLKEITKTVCGPEFERLVFATAFCDPSCVDIFRFGADLYGELFFSGSGARIINHCQTHVDELRTPCLVRNNKLIKS